MPSTEKIAYNFTMTYDELDSINAFISDVAEDGAYAVDTKIVLDYLLKRLEEEYNVKWKACDSIASFKVTKHNDEALFSFMLMNRNADLCVDATYRALENGVSDEKRAMHKKKSARFLNKSLDEGNNAQYVTNMCIKQIKEEEPRKVGVDGYVNRLIQTLSRKTMSSPMLVGDRGVGKTAIVKEFVNRIIEGNVPKWLKDATVYSVDLVKMVAGAKFRGDFEARLTDVINAARKCPNVILFIDNTHTLIGAGANSDNPLDGAGIIEPFISDGSLRVIGATTFENYSKIMRAKDTMSRCFYNIDIDEPDIAQANAIVEEYAKSLSKYHKLDISSEIVKLAVKLSKRYRTSVKLPHSAIDLLDEACAKQKIVCAETKPTKRSLRKSEEPVEPVEPVEQPNVKLESETLYSIISEQMGIPLNKISESDNKRLLTLETTLGSRVIGQEEAIKSLSQSIRCSRVGLNSATRPLGSFIFAGTTGVGKTELCKALASELFGDETAIVRVDMSELMEEHSISKLIGSPPGYVGFDDGGYLTEAIAKKPYSIVLFDEIEKAHPKVMNLLLQVLDDGRLTDSKGKTVDFKNTIIIMTTNVGAKKKGESPHVGFGSVAETDRKADFVNAIKQTFKPEFVNRIDDIIIFNKLDEAAVKRIASNMLDNLARIASERDISISFDDSVVDYCAKEGFDSEMGARPMLHFINKNINSKIANWLLDGSIEPDKHYNILYSSENLVCECE